MGKQDVSSFIKCSPFFPVDSLTGCRSSDCTDYAPDDTGHGVKVVDATGVLDLELTLQERLQVIKAQFHFSIHTKPTS